MIKKLLAGIIAAVFFIVLGFIIAWSGRNEANDLQYFETFRNFNKIMSVEIPGKLTFAAEVVPGDRYNVYEALEREFTVNTYWHSNTILMMKRSKRFFPVIEPILAKNKIPDDFKYLAVAESGLTNAISPAGAVGIWQFLEKTAKETGLEVSPDVDERYHLIKATEAACKYLNDSYRQFGSWFLAAAAFNAGRDRIFKALAEQKVNSYFDLHLNEETSRYLFRMIAIKTIFEIPENYGYYLRNKDLYQAIPVRLVKVDSTINDLPAFAMAQDINYKILREFNPWLRSYKLNNPNRKSYSISIPDKEFLSREKVLRLIETPENNPAKTN